jgi:hypothetical protein
VVRPRRRNSEGDEKAVVKRENSNRFILKVGSRSLASVGGRAVRPLEQPGEQGPLSELIPCLRNPGFLI